MFHTSDFILKRHSDTSVLLILPLINVSEVRTTTAFYNEQRCHLLPYCGQDAGWTWRGQSVSQMPVLLPFLSYHTFYSSFTRLEGTPPGPARSFILLNLSFSFLWGSVSCVANVNTNKVELNWMNLPHSAAATSGTVGAPRSKTLSKKREKTAAMATRPSRCVPSTHSNCWCYKSSLHNYSVTLFLFRFVLERGAGGEHERVCECSRCFECGW